MRYIVTGGAGFIGSHLVESLIKKDSEVIVIDNLSTGRIENLSHLDNNYRFIEDDISTEGKWTEYFKNIDCVFHLAALADVVPSIKVPQNYFNSNVRGTFNVLQASRNYNVKKIIYSASSSCYGIPKNYPTPEDEKCDPQYPYALTKYLGEQMIIHWSKIYKIPSVSLRFFNVFGPRSRTSGTYGAVFGVFLKQKLSNKPYTVVGDGKQTRDFTFVSDVVKAIYLASISNLESEIINIGSNNTYSINRLVQLLKGDKVNLPKRPGEPDCTWANIKKAKRLLKWEPKINFEDGVNIMLKNIDYWNDAPLWDQKLIKDATRTWFEYLG